MSSPPVPPPFERSARTDVRYWAMLLMGAVFLFGGLTIAPEENCSEDGRECAPWLVPIAGVMGGLFAVGGASVLLANPRRGSRIDAATGDLVWWQRRHGTATGDEGRIHPSQIGRIVVRGDENDEVHLYSLAGERQPFFDEEVIPWPYADWAAALARRWPHIIVETG